MTPTAILALARDIAIVGALAFVIWWIRNDGANSVKLQDLKALQSQLADNALRQHQFAQEVSDAQTQHAHDVETITAAIAAHSAQPVLVRIPAGPSPLHGVSATTGDQSAAGGPAHPGSGESVPSIDIRPGLIGFEQRYENALNDCRQALASWPH